MGKYWFTEGKIGKKLIFTFHEQKYELKKIIRLSRAAVNFCHYHTNFNFSKKVSYMQHIAQYVACNFQNETYFNQTQKKL
jgi:hypothetical protein